MDRSRLSVCSIPLRERPLREALQVLAAAGCARVDLLGAEPHFPPAPDADAVAAIAAAGREAGVRVANLATYYGRSLPGTPEEAEAELAAARRGMDAAVRLGARSLRLHPGRDRRHETGFALVPFFRQVAGEAEARGLYLGIETHGGLSSDAPAMVELCRQVGSRHFGVLFDPCNCARVGVDYRQAWDTFKGYVTHVHLKDGRRAPDGAWEHVHLGEGEIDARWLVRELDRAGYQGDLALEYEMGATEPPETGLPRWLAYCAAL